MRSGIALRQPALFDGPSMPQRAEASLEGVYYLLLRCLPGRSFFVREAEYAACRERLVDQLGRNNHALLDYCLTPTEIRLVVQLHGRIGPGRLIQELFSSWFREMNRRDGCSGHVLAERVRSRQVTNSDELRRIVCFLARLPVDAQLAAAASAYRHGGYRAHLGIDPAAGLGVRFVLLQFGQTMVDGREQLRRAVRGFEPTQEEYDRLRTLPWRNCRGAPKPTVSAASALLGETDQDLRLQITARVERELCCRHGIPPTALFATPTPPGAALVRSIIVHVLTSANVLRLATLARRYRRTPQTLKGEMGARIRHSSAQFLKAAVSLATSRQRTASRPS